MTKPPLHTSSTHPPCHAIFLLYVTTFLFATGLTMVLPVLPFMVASYVPAVSQQAVAIGWLTAAFALCSFLASPVLGALSDAFGRRSVLLLTLSASVIGYVLFGIGGSLWVLFLGRILDGLGFGGMGAVFGYVADTTTEEERGAFFGRFGAILGLATIVGPALGGLASRISLSAPFFFAAGIAALNLLWTLFFLPESLAPERRTRDFDFKHLNPLTQLTKAVSFSRVRTLVIVSMLFMLPFAMMQATNALLARDTLRWGPAQISTMFMIVGLLDIVSQGILLPFLLRVFKEKRVALLGLTLGLLGLCCYALLAVTPHPALLYVGIIMFAVGEGMFTATSAAMVSSTTPADAQGSVQGSFQAFGSLAQMVGPVLGGQLYSRVSLSVPYWTGAGFVAVALGLLARQGDGANASGAGSAPLSPADS